MTQSMEVENVSDKPLDLLPTGQLRMHALNVTSHRYIYDRYLILVYTVKIRVSNSLPPGW